MADTETPTRGFSKALLDTSLILAVVTAFLFLLGRSYFEAYFYFFGIRVQSLDLPFSEGVFFSVVPILGAIGPLVKLALWVALLVMIAFVLVYALEQLWGWLERRDTQVGRILHRAREMMAPSAAKNKNLDIFTSFKFALLAVMAFLILPLSLSIAVNQGTEQAEKIYNNPQTRTFLFFKRVEHQAYDDELMSINLDGGLRFLTQTKDLVIVFAKRESRHGRRLTFVVPMANLISIRNDALHSKR
jgi:hypothetical protein